MGIEGAWSRAWRAAAVAALPFLASAQSADSGNASSPPGPTAKGWQNPEIGLVLDMTAAASDIEEAYSGWSLEGMRVRSVELALSQNIDPFGSLYGNVFFDGEGVELHEAWFRLHTLPGNLSLKGGHMLANFGHFGQFHTHFLPFASDTRLYREYLGGVPLMTGMELSWLAPLDFFLEVTGSVFHRIRGDSHDFEPAELKLPSEADRLAAELGYRKHGTHYDKPGGGTITAEEILAQSEGPAPLENNLYARDLAYGGRAATSVELGENWSVDMGASGLFQYGHLYSQRIPGKAYPKAVYGGDINFFWHPLAANRYRSLDFGLEALANYQGFERLSGGAVSEERLHRGGVFGHLRFRHSARWQYGAFAEVFQPAQDDARKPRDREGLFLTFSPSHFQFFRVEISRYRFQTGEEPVHRLVLQYDGLIGFHSHGRKR